MADYGASDTSTTVLGNNQFPISEVYVPNGSLTALEGGPASTDSGGKKSAPASMYVKDGGDVTQGTSTDANTVNSVMGRLTKIRDLLSATLTVAVSGNVTEANSAAIKADLDAILAALDDGQETMANSLSVAIASDQSAVPVSGSVSVSNFPGTQPVSGTVSVNALPAGSNTIGGVELVDSGGTNKASISAGGAVKVDNSAVTQPVSGSVSVSNFPGTQAVSGTVTANVGTTNGLALDTSVNGVIVAQGSTTSGEKGPLVQGAVTTAAPTYTTAQTSPISLTTAGAVRVDGSATTQPVSGTFWQATQPVSGTVTVQQSTASNLKVDLSGTAANATAIKVDGSAVTQPVSGTVTANQGGTWTEAPSAATSGGSTPYHLISAATTNATNVKNAAGNLYGFEISNTNAAARYVRFYDSASAPTMGTTPIKKTVQIPGNATVIRAYPVGLSFGSGIGFSTTTAMGDADTSTVGAGDLSIDLDYK